MSGKAKNRAQERWAEKREEKTREIFPTQMSLERVPVFTPSSTQQLELLQSKRVEHQDMAADIRCPYGLPVTFDLDLYRAFQKILFEHIANGNKIDRAVTVPTNRLLRYAGKHKYGSKNRKGSVQAVKTWLDRMSSISIVATFYEGKDRKPTTLRGGVFDAIVSPGERHDDIDSVAETNYVFIGHILKRDITENNVRYFDLDFHLSLRKAIAKSLYPLLATSWYASKGKMFKKRYSHLRDLFLITPYTSLSRVKQQLEPSLKELQKTDFIANWSIKPSKSFEGDFVISATPGPRYRAFLEEIKDRKRIAQRIEQSMEDNGVKTELAPKDLMLLEDILTFNKDEHSRNGYRHVVENYPESTVRAALSETKLADRQGKIRTTRGQYFMDVLKHLDRYKKN